MSRRGTPIPHALVAQDAEFPRTSDGETAAPVLAVDHLDRRHRGVAARRADCRQNLAFARVSQGVESRERTDIVEVLDHVRVEDDARDIRRRLLVRRGTKRLEEVKQHEGVV